MKSLRFKIANTENESFKVQVDKMLAFYGKFHQHHEIQLTYIIKGQGTLLMEDYMEAFSPGDVFVIPSNAAHLFRSVVKENVEGDEIQSHSISVFFDSNFLGKRFLEVAETFKLKAWMAKTDRGIKVLQPMNAAIAHGMNKMPSQSGMERLITFLDILKNLTENQDFVYLSKTTSTHPLPAINEENRLQQIITFSYREFYREIKLEEVAQMSHLTIPAFCKYFKLHTRKTYLEFLNEIRISKACKLLRNQELSIGQIADEAGFNNITNFNRKFKQINGQTPSSFRKQYISGVE